MDQTHLMPNVPAGNKWGGGRNNEMSDASAAQQYVEHQRAKRGEQRDGDGPETRPASCLVPRGVSVYLLRRRSVV